MRSLSIEAFEIVRLGPIGPTDVLPVVTTTGRGVAFTSVLFRSCVTDKPFIGKSLQLHFDNFFRGRGENLRFKLGFANLDRFRAVSLALAEGSENLASSIPAGRRYVAG